MHVLSYYILSHTHLEWLTKSYTGICTSLPSLMSHRVETMSSLSNASGEEARGRPFNTQRAKPGVHISLCLKIVTEMQTVRGSCHLGGQSWTVPSEPWPFVLESGLCRSCPGSGWPLAAGGGQSHSDPAAPWSYCKRTTTSKHKQRVHSSFFLIYSM